MNSTLAAARVREIKCGMIGDPTRWPDQQVINTTEKDIRFAQDFRNALSTVDGSSGGYLSPEHTLGEIVEVNLGEASIMRQVANVTPGTHINENFPVLDDGQTEGRIGGNNQASTDTDPAFGSRNSVGFDFRSDNIRAPQGLLEDAPQLAAVRIPSVLFRRVGRRQNRAFTVGTGSGEPQGVLTGSEVGVTTASNFVITIDEVIDLVTSLDSEYINGASLMMNPLIYRTLRKLKDGQGVHLWAQAGLDRYRLALNSHMPSSISASAKMILFGDFKRAYTIRELQTKLWTFNERYADLGQVAFEGTQIADGFMVDSGAVRCLKMHD